MKSAKKIPLATERRSHKRRQYSPGERADRRGGFVHPGSDTTPDDLEFLKAIQRFKEEVNPFPSWTEVLDILFALGYRKIAEKSKLPGVS
jgi:hypothetical protein